MKQIEFSFFFTCLVIDKRQIIHLQFKCYLKEEYVEYIKIVDEKVKFIFVPGRH